MASEALIAAPSRSDPRPIRGRREQVWLEFRSSAPAMVGGAIVLIVALCAVLAPWIAPHDPIFQARDGLSAAGTPLQPWVAGRYPLGTDNFGRDLASRLVYGARISLVVGVLANGLAVVVGVAVGGVAGFNQGPLAAVLMRVVDILMSFPLILLAVALVAVLKPSASIVIIVIGAVSWVSLARVVYGEVLSVREYDYILAARSVGARPLRIMLRHILPQLLSVIIVYATLGISTAIRTEATLSFLGVGIPPPDPTWGGMLQEGQRYFRSAPWLILFPGLAVTITVLGFNLLGDGLRDALDPHRRGRSNSA